MPPEHKEIDYDVLRELCEIQCTGEECCAILAKGYDNGKLDYDTLNNALKRDGHGGFSEYFKKHSADGKASLRRVQFSTAKTGSVPMLIWLGKQHLDQRDKPAEGEPSEGAGVNVTFSVSEPVKDVKVTRGKG